jgi:DNA-binding NtrC family response regulator
MTGRILIVDDDPVQRRLLSEAAKRFGFDVEQAEGGQQAVDLLTGRDGAGIDVVILDLVMPDLDGMGVLERMKQAHVAKPVIVQTAHGGIDTVVSAMRAGAFDFVVKPVSPERLQVSIKNALRVNALEGEITRIRHQASGTLTFKNLVTRSEAMARVIALGERAASSQIPILLEGESGVGKEVIARAIKGQSDRKAKPFVTVNCGAIPENLVESILFGHEKGAFTGATEKHLGKFVEAHGGTLFLDEVGELPPNAQVKLLRALQEGEVDPVGARKPVKVDFRLISATNRDMIALVEQGRFREDLYYRLNVFPIHIPALRRRPEDVPDLARLFLARFAAEEGKPVHAISPSALALLKSYDWPGNIRQLENAMFRAVVLCDGAELTVEEFPQIAAQVKGFEPRLAVRAPAPQMPAEPEPDDLPEIEETEPASESPTVAPFGFIRLLDDSGQIRPLESLEEEVIRLAIERYQGRMSEVARRLGIGRSTLYRKLADYGLQARAS